MSPEELQTRARRVVGEVLNQRDHAVANELEGEIAEGDPWCCGSPATALTREGCSVSCQPAGKPPST